MIKNNKFNFNMMNKRVPYRFQMLYVWIFSYLIICLLLFVCNLMLYNSQNKAAREHTEKSYEAFLNSTVLQFDSKISQLDGLYTTISTNSLITDVISNNEQTSIEMVYPVSQELAKQQQHTSFSRIYLYLQNRDIIISNSVSCSASEFYHYYYENNNISYTNWVNAMHSEKQGAHIITYNDDERYLDFIYRIPVYKNGVHTTDATLVFQMNDTTLRALSYTDDKIGTVIILDQNDNVVMSDSGDIPDNLKYSDFEDGEVIKKNGVVSLCSISAYTGWKFLFVSRVNDFYSATERISRIHILIIVLSMITSFLLSILFSVKNYRPLNELITAYRHSVEKKAVENMHDYALVKNAISDYVSSKRNLNILENDIHNFKMNEVFEKLLQGYTETEETDIEFPSDLFVVILFRPRNNDNLFGEDKTSDDDVENTTFFIIQNIMEELLNRGDYFRVIKYRDCIAGIYCCENQHSAEVCKTKIFNNVTYGSSFIKNNFQFECEIGVSSVKNGLSSISAARKEAQIAIDNAGSKDIIFYEDMNEVTLSTDRDFLKLFSSNKATLLSDIENNDAEGAKKVLDKIYNSCIKLISVEKTQLIIMQLLGDILSLVDEEHMDTVADNMQTIDVNSNPSESRYALKKLIDYMCSIKKEAHTDTKNMADGDVAVTQIVEFIQNNYADYNLTADFIGNKFDISPRQLSKLFKSAVGESPANYIARFRIGKAKFLLKTTSLPITQIYHKCGFISEKTFFRTFMKYEEVTPGKYRETNQI